MTNVLNQENDVENATSNRPVRANGTEEKSKLRYEATKNFNEEKEKTLVGGHSIEKKSNVNQEEKLEPIIKLRQKLPRLTTLVQKPSLGIDAKNAATFVSEKFFEKLAPKSAMQPNDAGEMDAQNHDNGSLNGHTDGAAAGAIQRAMESLHDTSANTDDNNEEIRRLDSQLDHLNEYMDKVEERLKAHSERLMETLKQQKEERERRRRSFHERLDANRQEDDDFQRQLSQILHRVDSLKR